MLAKLRTPVTAKPRMLGDDLLVCVLGGVFMLTPTAS
jgi:hypothetical protein